MDAFLIKLLILTSVLTSTALAQSGTDVDNLLAYLFATQGYNKKVRPLRDQTQTMNIDTDFVLNSVIDFDEQAESMKTSGYLYLTWTDQYLSWNPSAYNNTYDLFVPQDDIWKPDVSLANAFKTFTGMGASYLNVRIYFTGEVEWKPYQVFESTCSVDITYFPFDSQTCELKFTAWSYRKAEVELNKGSRGIILEDYSANAAWTLVETSAREINTDEAAAIFSMKLKRKPRFYVINVMIPVVFLTILNIFTFVLPVTSGERASFAITVFLSLAVFLTIIASELPKNSENTSLLAIYLMLMSSLSTLIVALSLVEIRLSCRKVSKTPINRFFMLFVKIQDMVTCKKSKRTVGPEKSISKTSLKDEAKTGLQNEAKTGLKDEAEDGSSIKWKHVIDAMDFVLFWSALIYTFLCTLVLGVVAVNN